MVTEFDTFRIKVGKEDRAKEWMRVLNQRKEECIRTLPREKMALETIFMSERDGRLFISWFSIQGDNAENVDTSDHEIDKLHCQFWDECIDQTYKLDKFEHVLTLADHNVAKSLTLAAKETQSLDEYGSENDPDIAALVAMNANLIIDEGHTYRLTTEELTDRVHAWLKNGFQYQIFRDQDGQTFGYAFWREQPDHILLRQFFIKDAFRRKGLGTQKIHELLEGPWKGWTSIRLEVLDRNDRAQAFWQSLGFVQYARTLELKNA